MAKKTSTKRYNIVGGLPLHDARRLLGIPIISHTGRVNAYARCMGSKLKSATSLQTAQSIMTTSVGACGGVAGGKAKSWVRKDGRRVTTPR